MPNLSAISEKIKHISGAGGDLVYLIASSDSGTLSIFGWYLQAVEPSAMTGISTWRNYSQLIMFLQPIALTTRACESVSSATCIETSSGRAPVIGRASPGTSMSAS